MGSLSESKPEGVLLTPTLITRKLQEDLLHLSSHLRASNTLCQGENLLKDKVYFCICALTHRVQEEILVRGNGPL